MMLVFFLFSEPWLTYSHTTPGAVLPNKMGQLWEFSGPITGGPQQESMDEEDEKGDDDEKGEHDDTSSGVSISSASRRYLLSS